MASETSFYELADRYGVQPMSVHHWLVLSKTDAGEYIFEIVHRQLSSNGTEGARLKAIEAKAEALFLYQQLRQAPRSSTGHSSESPCLRSSADLSHRTNLPETKCVIYSESESTNMKLSKPVSTLQQFLSHVRNQTSMITPKLYVYSSPNNPLSRLQIETPQHFRQLILHPEHPDPVYLYEGGAGGFSTSRPTDRNGLPLIVITQFPQQAFSVLSTPIPANLSSSNSFPHGSTSSPEYAHERMATLVADRDSYSCVVTNVSKIGGNQLATFNACHILAAAESRRTISSEYIQEMQRVRPNDYQTYKSWWVPSSQNHYLVQLPYPDSYDPRLALFLQASFKGLLDRGEVWFATDPETQRITIQFEEGKGDLDKYNNAEIRRPDDGKTLDQRTSAEIVKKVVLWPDLIVFDLHRAVLAPYYRWQRYQRETERTRNESNKKQKQGPQGPSPAQPEKSRVFVEQPLIPFTGQEG